MSTTTHHRLAWAPWTDKKGRFDPLRAAVLTLLLLPGLFLAARLSLGLMGARPVNAAIHSTGYWAVIFLVASLVVTPAKAFLAMPGLVVIRRMIGNAALCYALIHLTLYCIDENGHMLVVIREIALRFYLTIGFVALLGLLVLGLTSTDDAIRRLGPRWKQLHRSVYAIATLALFHFVLQTKADVSVPLLFIGLFYWLMIWRLLPAGRDRGPLAIVGLTLAAAVLTFGTEWLWYRFGTHIDPAKIIQNELDIGYGLLPTGQMLVLGLLALAGFYLRRLSQGRAGQSPLFWMGLFASGAALNELAVYVFDIDRLLDPGDYSYLYQDLAWAVLLGVLGYVRWRCRDQGSRFGIDLLGLACVTFQLMLSDNGLRGAGIVFAVAIAAVWAILAWRTWARTKLAAASWIPASLVLAYGVTTLMQ